MNITILRLICLVSFGTLALCLDYTYPQFWLGIIGLVSLGLNIIEMNWEKTK